MTFEEGAKVITTPFLLAFHAERRNALGTMKNAPKTVALDRLNAARTIFLTVAHRDKYCPIRGILRMSSVGSISLLSIRRRLCHRKICCPRPPGIREDNLSSDVAGLCDTSYELFTNSFGNSSRTGPLLPRISSFSPSYREAPSRKA